MGQKSRRKSAREKCREEEEVTSKARRSGRQKFPAARNVVPLERTAHFAYRSWSQ